MMGKRMKGWLGGELVSLQEQDALGLRDIPIAAGVDIPSLVGVAPDPFYVYVRAGRIGLSASTTNGKKRNWLLRPLERVHEALPLYGYRGHPDPEEFKRQRMWRDFVTVWVGGLIRDGALYLKGFVPASEKDFKELIQLSLAAGKPMQVSPWGTMLMQDKGDMWDVYDMEPISVDWGPPGDAGFEDADVLAVGGELKHDDQEVSMTEKEIAQMEAENKRLGGELKTAQDALEIEKKKGSDLDAKVTELGGELKTLQDAAATVTTAAVAAKRTELLGALPEPMREVGGELLTGDTVEDLDKSFAGIKEKLAKMTPGMKLIGGELKKEEGKKKDEDFASD